MPAIGCSASSRLLMARRLDDAHRGPVLPGRVRPGLIPQRLGGGLQTTNVPSRAPTVRQAIDRARPAVRVYGHFSQPGEAASTIFHWSCVTRSLRLRQDDCRDVFWPRLHRHVVVGSAVVVAWISSPSPVRAQAGSFDPSPRRCTRRLVLPGGVGHLLPEGLAENRPGSLPSPGSRRGRSWRNPWRSPRVTDRGSRCVRRMLLDPGGGAVLAEVR